MRLRKWRIRALEDSGVPIFDIFVHPKTKAHEAVKKGFSWPGFLFGVLWAFEKKMPLHGFMLYVLLVVLGSFEVSDLFGSHPFELQYSNYFFSRILIAGVAVFVGFKGNSWRRYSLEKAGFEWVAAPEAQSSGDALAGLSQDDNSGDVRVKYIRFATVVAAVVLLDQLSKGVVLKLMPLYKSIQVIPGFFNISHVHNPGGAFSFLAQNGSPWRHWIFLGAGLFALVLILYFHSQTPKTHPYLALSLSLIFGGAIGNLVDRVRLGEVVDFIDIYVGPWHWPTFNVADSAVTVGIGIFVAHLIFKKMPF